MVAHNCTCKKVVTTARKLCRCQKKTKVEKCKDTYTELTTVAYAKGQDRCVRSIFAVNQPIICPKPKITEGQCDPKTCLKKVKFERNVVHGCKCVLEVFEKEHACCCDADTEANKRAGACAEETVCSRNSIKQVTSCQKVELVDSKLQLFAGVEESPLKMICKRMTTVTIEPVLCKSQISNTKDCDHENNLELMTIFGEKVKNCKCEPIKSTLHLHGCSKGCPDEKIVEGQCVGGIRNVKCACANEEKRVTVKDAIMTIKTVTEVLHEDDCYPKSVVKILPITVPDPIFIKRPVPVVKGPCVEGKMQVVVATANFDAVKANYVVNSSTKSVICGCPVCHESKPTCSKDGKKLISNQTCYSLKNGACEPTTREVIEDARLMCSFETTTTVGECVNGTRTVERKFNRLGDNCQCVKDVLVKKEKCGCKKIDKEIVSQKCENNTKVTVTTRNKLQGDQCVPYNTTTTEHWGQAKFTDNAVAVRTENCDQKTCLAKYGIWACKPTNCTCNFVKIAEGPLHCCLDKMATKYESCSKIDQAALDNCFGISEVSGPCSAEGVSRITYHKKDVKDCKCIKTPLNTTERFCGDNKKDEPKVTSTIEKDGSEKVLITAFKRPAGCEGTIKIPVDTVKTLPTSKINCEESNKISGYKTCRDHEKSWLQITEHKQMTSGQCTRKVDSKTCDCPCQNQEKKQEICDSNTGTRRIITYVASQKLYAETCKCNYTKQEQKFKLSRFSLVFSLKLLSL
ncbi:hypothetical protein Ciccas_006833 [Cichlidogyrus casuarinus]|uniref:Uncharacterized protein n=1 Tax=Cichlidogyrus casuarinus TaxID=1844966 RepID=A0ABD2Q738_9PLAT